MKKRKRRKISNQVLDIIKKANSKAREEEIAEHGKQISFRTTKETPKTIYKRENYKRIEED